jgi:hypothetical protein
MPEIMAEIARVEALYKEGKRAYPVAKACKKDEVLPRHKKKCRIFYANPITLTFLVRKYFLPIIRFLQMNPLLADCAVGINCHGPEWEEFYKHITKFGMDRLIGGDYAKYDQKLTSQLLLAALRICIDLASECQYDETDIRAMSAMAADMVYAYVAVNGDLIRLQSGTHISGNSMTVILNGICGSLNLRAFFYSEYPETVSFRDAAAMGTYGDDNLGSANPLYPKFTIKGIANFLAKYNQTYTMPDKNSELKEYLNADQFEFLKRTSVYHPVLQRHLGALADDSIFKSLHNYLRPKGAPLTPSEAVAQNIDTALREWFNHGPEVYEMRRKQMQEIAARHDITHMTTLLDRSYEEGVADWIAKYVDQETKEYLGVERFEMQSGVEEESSSEDEELSRELYIKAMSDVDMGLMAKDLQISIFGEIDLIMMRVIDSVSHILVVEIKHSKNLDNKARKQARKYFKVMQILQPQANILACIYTFNGWKPVARSEKSLSGWLSIASDSLDEGFQKMVAEACLF